MSYPQYVTVDMAENYFVKCVLENCEHVMDKESNNTSDQPLYVECAVHFVHFRTTEILLLNFLAHLPNI